MNEFNELFDSKYKRNKSVFGDEPIPLVTKTNDYIQRGNVLDLGVGDGRNAIYFLKKGFEVTGVDMSAKGLDSLKSKIQDKDFADKLTLIKSDVLDLQISEEFDIILGIGLLHFLEYSDIEKLIKWVKAHTKTGGLNVFATRMKQNYMNNLPFIFGENDLKAFYTNSSWKVLEYEEKGRATIIAQKE